MHPRAAHFKDCYLRLLATLCSVGLGAFRKTATAVSQNNLPESVAARQQRGHRLPPAKNIHGERQENRHQDEYVHVLDSHQYYIDEKSILPLLSPLFLASLSPQSPGAYKPPTRTSSNSDDKDTAAGAPALEKGMLTHNDNIEIAPAYRLGRSPSSRRSRLSPGSSHPSRPQPSRRGGCLGPSSEPLPSELLLRVTTVRVASPSRSQAIRVFNPLPVPGISWRSGHPTGST